LTGNVFISVKDQDKRNIIFLAKQLRDLGFGILATAGTARVLQQNDIAVKIIPKLQEGIRPHIIDRIKNNEVALMINTPRGKATKVDETKIRSSALLYGVPLVTTLAGAQATVNGIEALIKKEITVNSIQEYHQEIKK